MSAIKKFFEKKKTDAKFKLAGTGQKLGDSNSPARPVPSERPSTSTKSGPARGQLSHQQKLAATAALSRVQQNQSSEDFEKRRSQAAIKAMAKKEMEREKQKQDEVQTLKATYGEKPIVEAEGPAVLSTNGVLYKCPLIGEQVLPKNEMRQAIRDFLYSQVDEEPGLTSCLIIHTLTGDQEKVQTCVDTLCKYVDNILKNPSEEKFRKIRKSNKAYIERVASVEGHDIFLEAAGFVSEVVDGDNFWIFPGDKIGEKIDHLQVLLEALVGAEPIRAELDRGLKVLLPNEANRPIALPPEFFVLSAEEIKKEQQAKSEAVERESMLRTKAMRQREEMKERRKYRYCLIRVRFPDGLVLQGTFSIYEKFKCVSDFVADCLEHPLPFVLHDGASGQSLDSDNTRDASLVDLGLVPTAILNFGWHPEVADEIRGQLGPQASYLSHTVASLATE